MRIRTIRGRVREGERERDRESKREKGQCFFSFSSELKTRDVRDGLPISVRVRGYSKGQGEGQGQWWAHFNLIIDNWIIQRRLHCMHSGIYDPRSVLSECSYPWSGWGS